MINNIYNTKIPSVGLLSLDDDCISDEEDNKIILDAKERIKKRSEDKHEKIEQFMKQFREYITELKMDLNYSYKIEELNNKYKNMFELEKQITKKKDKKKKNTYAEQLIGNLVDDLDDIKINWLVDKKPQQFPIGTRSVSPMKLGSIFNPNPNPNFYGYTGSQIISHPVTQQTICLPPPGFQHNQYYSSNDNAFVNTYSSYPTGYNMSPVNITNESKTDNENLYNIKKNTNSISECNYCAMNGILNKFGKVPYHLESECFNKYPSKRPNNYKERSPINK